MGQERETTLRLGKVTSRGKALLETDEILFRDGERRVVIPLASITKVDVDDGHLRLTSKAGVADFELGAAAAAWGEKIRNPKGRLDKLGVKPGAEVVVVGRFDDALRPELEARACRVKSRASRGHALVLFAAESAKDLARIADLREALADDGALWIVYPKGRQEIRERDVLEAGRAAALKDHKVARFSETHTALKFVIPTALRKV